MKERVQIFGRFLSGMVMPNFGAFIAWGLIAVLFIPDGWFPNTGIATLVDPMPKFLLPLLIGYTVGRMVGGIGSIVEDTKNLPKIPSGKKLTYTQFDMPLTAIDDFREKGRTDPLFARLADFCDAHSGLWNAEAEQILFRHFGIK